LIPAVFAALLIVSPARPLLAIEPSEIYDRFGPAVVTIVGTEGVGSGFAIPPTGDVVTNYHVIQGQRALRIILRSGEERNVVAVLAQDPERDLAVLRVVPPMSATVVLGDSANAKPGTRVTAIASPRGLPQSVTDGIVSQIRSLTGITVLQTTAPISPGSSGGPLFNDRGEVIGVISFFLAKGQNLNFAVGINEVGRLLGGALASKRREPLSPTPNREAPEIPPRREVTRPPPTGQGTGAQYASEDGEPLSLMAGLNVAIRGRATDQSASDKMEMRGALYLQLGELYRHRAVGALSEAIRLDPRRANAYVLRGMAFLAIGQYQRAVEDTTEALRLGQDLWAVYDTRGDALLRLGDFQRAINDFREVLWGNPTSPTVYLRRSIAYWGLGRPDWAAADAETHLTRFGWQGRNAQFAALLAHLGYREAGRGADAARILEDAVRYTGSADWPGPLVRYFRRETTAAAVWALADTIGKQTEAYTYLGIDFARSGRASDALSYLRWVQENGDRRLIAYGLALIELRRLEGR